VFCLFHFNALTKFDTVRNSYYPSNPTYVTIAPNITDREADRGTDNISLTTE